MGRKTKLKKLREISGALIIPTLMVSAAEATVIRTEGVVMPHTIKKLSLLIKAICLLGALSLLTACGSGLEGSYSNERGTTKYNFTSSDKVYVSLYGMEAELDYKKNGNKIKISGPDGKNQILTLADDGSLTGMGMRFTKK